MALRPIPRATSNVARSELQLSSFAGLCEACRDNLRCKPSQAKLAVVNPVVLGARLLTGRRKDSGMRHKSFLEKGDCSYGTSIVMPGRI